MNYFLQLIFAFFCLYMVCECSTEFKHHPIHSIKNPINKLPKHAAKIVNYIGKSNEKYLISHIPVRNLEIEYVNPLQPWIAKSIWNNDYNTTGWSILEIETNGTFSDAEQAYAAGLLEGVLTKDLISLHIINTVGDFCETESEICDKVFSFMSENFKWMSKQIQANYDDPYWHQVNLTLAQLDGLYHGYIQNFNVKSSFGNFESAFANDKSKILVQFIVLQLNGDMGEIMAALTNKVDPFMAGSCSALIKLLKNNADLYVSHDTWTEYESMLRIIKSYKFNYHLFNQNNTLVAGTHMTFSSYPGILSSIDDFYLTSANLTVMETTIGNSNADLWKFVIPETNLYWIRILAANRLASNGKEWANWFSLYNSGTYNNQWMIVDYKKFVPTQPVQDGLLTVLEQIPGYIYWEDKTNVLRDQSYWSSYNLPYYPFIYNISGVYDSFVKYGDFFSYSETPRAKIFRRDHSTVTDVNSMIKLMRYNDFTEDPFSKCDCNPPYTGEYAIAARSDLNPASGTYPFDALGHRDHGATDMKLTTSEMSKTLGFIGISGPTHGSPGIPPFQWSTADFGNTTSHLGHPDKWTFEPLYVNWSF